jgi:hypothetical protein
VKPRRDIVDIVDIDGLRDPSPTASTSGDASAGPRRFLSVWYRCCHTYGRMERNAAGTAYEGRCPSCGAPVRARIGPGGTSRRTFEAR